VRGAKKLPLYLLDAIREVGKSRVLRAAMGDEFVDAYLTIKQREWDSYAQHLSAWEREHTLDI